MIVECFDEDGDPVPVIANNDDWNTNTEREVEMIKKDKHYRLIKDENDIVDVEITDELPHYRFGCIIPIHKCHTLPHINPRRVSRKPVAGRKGRRG